MRSFLPTMLLVPLLFSCGPAEFIFESSESLVATDENASALFAPAQKVLQANCVSCHAVFGEWSEAEFVELGYVVLENPDQSKIFNYIRGSNSGGPESMPTTKTLSAADIETIRSWIAALSSVNSGSPKSPEELRWLKAQSLIQNKCVTCHGASESPFFAAADEQEMISKRLITPGSANTSKIYEAMRKTGGDVMPPAPASPLTAGELQVIADWINGIP